MQKRKENKIMSKFSKFMKANKTLKENERYAVTKFLCGEDGKPLEWEFRHLTSKQNDAIRDECVREIPVAGRANMYRQKLDASKYIHKLIAASVVEPDLFDTELQDSYGVCTPEELLYAMVDDPGEYNDLAAFVQKLNGFDVSFDDKVEKAKN